MNSNDTIQNSSDPARIICDHSHQLENDSDDLDVYETVSRDITPVNSSLQYYIKSLNREITHDTRGTTSKDYGNGDKRGNPVKRYKDVLVLYNYVKENLKLEETRKLFEHCYKGVLDDMYSKSSALDIGLEELKLLGYVPTFPMEVKSCSGYIIYVYRSVTDSKSKEKYMTSYGYIYVFNGNSVEIIPFSNGRMKSVGETRTVKGKLKALGDKDFKTVFNEAKSNGFETKNLIAIVENTTKIIVKSVSDPGFKFTFVTTGITRVTIQSLL